MAGLRGSGCPQSSRVPLPLVRDALMPDDPGGRKERITRRITLPRSRSGYSASAGIVRSQLL